MLKNAKLVIASMFLLAGSVGVAAARDGHGPGGPPSKDEAAAFDRNRDGKLDDAERAELHKAMEAKRAERHKQMLAQFDRNHDGKLDDAERTQAHEAMLDQKATEHFKLLDTNNDGAISLAELKAGVRQHHQLGGRGPRPMGRMGHGGPMGRMGEGGPMGRCGLDDDGDE